MPITHQVLALVFGLPRDLDNGMIDPRGCMVGTRNCGTSLQVMSTFEYEQACGTATLLLNRSRWEQFRTAGYEVAVVNTTVWRIQSGKVKCSEMQVVGDLDRWNREVKLAAPVVRRLSSKEVYGLMGAMAVNPS
jgi:hypothetical protein